MNNGYYYLHTNGSLIYKRYTDDSQVADFRESDFVKHFWSVNPQNRADAWLICVEAQVFGANPQDVQRLVDKWGLTNEDATHFAEYANFNLEHENNKFLTTTDNSKYCGEGSTAFEAICDLAKNLGVRPSKMWGASFLDLLSKEL